MDKMKMDSDKPMSERMKQAVDSPAESTFEAVWPDRWLRQGYDHPKWDDGSDVAFSLPRLLTAEPDYLALNAGIGAYWVEVMGCGNAMVKAMKVHKLDFLREWEYFFDIPVALFVWNSKHKNWGAVWLDDVLHDEDQDIRTLPKRKGDARAYPYYHWSWSKFRDAAFEKGTYR